VLDHAKIEAGRLELILAPLSLRGQAESVLALLRSNAQAKGLQLRLEIAPGTADAVIGDGQRLKQVLFNLVGNAIKFTENGHVMLSLAPAAALGAGRVGVAFMVSDTGIGIAEGELLAVFQPFHQAEETAKRLRSGTGLGLTISQRIVEAMGGLTLRIPARVLARPGARPRTRSRLGGQRL
jgi:two-component system, sensor histidine kinase